MESVHGVDVSWMSKHNSKGRWAEERQAYSDAALAWHGWQQRSATKLRSASTEET